MNKPKVGQIVYIKDRKFEPYKTPVTRVGRKYFYVNPTGLAWTERRYSIDNWVSEDDVGQRKRAYESLRAIMDEADSEKIKRKIRDWFDKSRFLPLENLREIDRMMEEQK